MTEEAINPVQETNDVRPLTEYLADQHERAQETIVELPPEQPPEQPPTLPTLAAPDGTVYETMTGDVLNARVQAVKPPEPPPSQFKPMTVQELNERVDAARKASPPAVQQFGKKVCILGFTESWRETPFQDLSWEVWGLNELYMVGIPRWTRWFELHTRELYTTDHARTHEHLLRLSQMTCPVYMHQHYDDIPCSVPFPLNEVIALAKHGKYLTNSISYMIGLAILEGFQTIRVNGVDMSHATEYEQQRASCEYWIGIAEGRGIDIDVAKQSDLLNYSFLYGYEEDKQQRFINKILARNNELQGKMHQLEMQERQSYEARHQYAGALQDSQHILSIYRQIQGEKPK